MQSSSQVRQWADRPDHDKKKSESQQHHRVADQAKPCGAFRESLIRPMMPQNNPAAGSIRSIQPAGRQFSPRARAKNKPPVARTKEMDAMPKCGSVFGGKFRQGSYQSC